MNSNNIYGAETHCFINDNKESEMLENVLIVDIQQKIQLSAYKYLPNNGDYDIFIDEINDGIEFKNDKKGKIHPNICIEIGQTTRTSNGKTVPSGLSITKSKYWMQYNQTYWYFAHTERIKRMYNWYINTIKEYEQTLCLSTLSGEALENLEKNLLNKRMGMRIIYRIPEEQSDGFVALMDLFLIPEVIYRKICLEFGNLEDITYKDIIKDLNDKKISSI